MSMIDTLQEHMPEGWLVDSGETLVCPCGYTIEWDGVCPEGHVSPLREMGWI